VAYGAQTFFVCCSLATFQETRLGIFLVESPAPSRQPKHPIHNRTNKSRGWELGPQLTVRTEARQLPGASRRSRRWAKDHLSGLAAAAATTALQSSQRQLLASSSAQPHANITSSHSHTQEEPHDYITTPLPIEIVAASFPIPIDLPPAQQNDVVAAMPGFDFSNYNRNAALHARGVPLPKATSTGTTIVGCLFEGGVVVRRLRSNPRVDIEN